MVLDGAVRVLDRYSLKKAPGQGYVTCRATNFVINNYLFNWVKIACIPKPLLFPVIDTPLTLYVAMHLPLTLCWEWFSKGYNRMTYKYNNFK